MGGGDVFVGGTGDKVAVGDDGGEVTVGAGEVGDGGGEVSVGPGEVGDGGGEVNVGPAEVAVGAEVAAFVADGAVVREGVTPVGRARLAVPPLVGKMSNACGLADGSSMDCVGCGEPSSGLPVA